MHTVLAQLLPELEADPDAHTKLTTALHYIRTVGNTPEEEIAEVIDHVGPHAKEARVTTEQQIEARGIKLGKARGIELGEARGIKLGEARGTARGRVEALIELLHTKFGPLPTTLERRVQSAAPEQIRTWLTQVLTATALDEMFA
ncbi:hypothetical protein [Nocardia macrotermitis]|uniref:DUF4351 domain-containing protein n=1 Tax=Nocardia macrotermitis TaxID=2585198 RepID=A0A7K0D7E3_9NOCA|nr:hypothetical protein [Nocardia macrotermitis]MQY21569.1 hypothetical protein [Nocardia macrotermitis]